MTTNKKVSFDPTNWDPKKTIVCTNCGKENPEITKMEKKVDGTEIFFCGCGAVLEER